VTRSSATIETARIYHTVQKAFQCVEPFEGMHVSYCQCWNKS